MGEDPHRAMVHPEATLGQFRHRAAQGEAPSAIRARSRLASAPLVFGSACPAILPGATLPVVRLRADRFTTRDGATPDASATARTVTPASSRASARARMSLKKGFGHAGRHP
jgi:hypothetical protein